MTLIVCRRGQEYISMAGDSYLEEPDSCVFDIQREPKVFHAHNGLLGLAGDTTNHEAILEACRANLTISQLQLRLNIIFEKEAETLGLLTRHDLIYYLDGSGVLTASARPYAAVGVARDFAMGCLAAGFDAHNTVSSAAQHCNSVRAPIRTLHYATGPTNES